MKYNKGEFIIYKSFGVFQIYEIVGLLSTSMGPRYMLKVWDSSPNFNLIGNLFNESVRAIDTDPEITLSRIDLVLNPSLSISGDLNYCPKVDETILNTSTRQPCNCEKFDVLNYGCKCGGT